MTAIQETQWGNIVGKMKPHYASHLAIQELAKVSGDCNSGDTVGQYCVGKMKPHFLLEILWGWYEDMVMGTWLPSDHSINSLVYKKNCNTLNFTTPIAFFENCGLC